MAGEGRACSVLIKGQHLTLEELEVVWFETSRVRDSLPVIIFKTLFIILLNLESS
jgi:hypothetical protein